MAIEEAFLAEHGFSGAQLAEETSAAAVQRAYHQSLSRGIQEATDSNQDHECHSQSQVSYQKFLFFPLCTFILLPYVIGSRLVDCHCIWDNNRI